MTSAAGGWGPGRPGGWSGTWSIGPADPRLRAQMRIGDAEREAAASALGEHFAAGRLSREEYDERSTIAWEARTLAALQPLFRDLPLPHGPLGPAAQQPPRGAPTGPTPWGRRVPWLPLLLVSFVVSALLHLPVWLLVVAAWILVGRRRHWRHGSGHYASGSSRRPRGTWS